MKEEGNKSEWKMGEGQVRSRMKVIAGVDLTLPGI